MRIIYTHGANASERSFAFIQQSLNFDKTHFCCYDSNKSTAEKNTQRFIDELKEYKEDFFLVAHSLGGIYSLYILKEFRDKVRGGITLSTPYNGSEIAGWARYMAPQLQLFKDISSGSNFISNSRSIQITVPWTQVVTTIGDVPWLVGPNDGICTRASMQSRSDMDFVEIDRNHYEIVQSQRVVDLITSRLAQLGNE
jgi:pimeloyl-ACP methyl ester carboxylesterase